MQKRKMMKTMDKILIFIGVFLLIFTSVMIFIYYKTGGVPDTLIVSIFGICGGEAGIMGWIKTTKDKFIDKDLEKERIKFMSKLDKARKVMEGEE